MAVKFQKGIDLVNQRGINVADPTGNTDIANKQYVDNVVAGLATKRYVRLASTANVTIASGLAAGQTIDGKTIATGDRILLKNQTTGTENGIYVAPASGAASRATDFDAGSEVPGALITVSEGTVNNDTMWLESTDGPITVGTTSLSFIPFTVGVTYTAGNGLSLASTVFSVAADGSSITVSGSGIKLGTAAGGAGVTVNGSTGVLDVGAGTGITVGSDTVGVDTSVVARKYAADCAATTNPQTFTHGLGNDITVQVWASNELVYPDITKSSTSGGQVTVDWATAPTAAQYRVVVHG